jgi:hypothetical protein
MERNAETERTPDPRTRGEIYLLLVDVITESVDRLERPPVSARGKVLQDLLSKSAGELLDGSDLIQPTYDGAVAMVADGHG